MVPLKKKKKKKKKILAPLTDRSSAELLVLLICPSLASGIRRRLSTFALNRYTFSSYSIILNFFTGFL